MKYQVLIILLLHILLVCAKLQVPLPKEARAKLNFLRQGGDVRSLSEKVSGDVLAESTHSQL